jgi:ATP-dependent Clp protease protease subunit
MKNKNISLNVYGAFHEINLFLPTRTIYFGGTNPWRDDDIVNSQTVAEVIKNLHILECEKIAPINLLLNTVGGSWNDGIVIYDLIKSLQSKVTIIGMGKVFSMGAVILQAGDERILTKNTDVMIHDGREGYYGDTKSFENWAKVSKRVRKTMYEIFYERMKEKNKQITLSAIENLCSHDTIYTAEEAVEIGLADVIMEKVKYHAQSQF